MTMSGGTVVVSGPANSGNGSIDYNGTFDLSAGELITVGSSGMAQTPSATSTQSFVGLTFSAQQSAGTVVHILAADGSVVAAFNSRRTFSSVVYSSPAVVSGQEYQAAVGGSVTGSTTGGLAPADSLGTAGSSIAATGTAGEVTAGMGGGG
jgi:hypothetical protein